MTICTSKYMLMVGNNVTFLMYVRFVKEMKRIGEYLMKMVMYRII